MRGRRFYAFTAAAAMLAAMAWVPPQAQVAVAVTGAVIKLQPHAPDAEAKIVMRRAPAAAWPAAGVGEAHVASSKVDPVQVGSLPVKVAPSKADRQVTVELLDRAEAAKRNVNGLLLKVSHTGDAAPTPIEVDYSGFAAAFGGNYGSRLALTTVDGGRVTPIRTRNDGGAKTLRADVPDGLIAVLSGPSGAAGSYQPTSLAPSSSWQVGLQSGDFSWRYPIDIPPMSGPVPQVALDYSSGSVDGRVASTNNQPDWVGEGFSFQPGFIERSYATCRDDGLATDDLCFASQNATVVLPGLSGELVRDAASGNWHAEHDQGWRVEQLFGATNGDNDGEYWRLTSPSGVQYLFGRNRLPEWTDGAPETNSAWTVPVYGNNSGEPCNAAPGWCTQAYRWNLDFIVDRHGDVAAYYYDNETNYYARGGSALIRYVRGGVLNRIDYGLRTGSVYTSNSFKRVLFTAGDRCIPGTSCVRTQPGNWPDVPWDQWCDASGCLVTAPTFWSSKRLARITTQMVLAGAVSDIDSWTLNHSYPAVTASTAALWLDSIVHTGLSDGSLLTLPAVTLDGVINENRVDGVDSEAALYKLRLNRITTEAGGQIDVTYALQECTPSTVVVADNNDKRCFPVLYGAGPSPSLFHKYVVAQVAESSLSGGNPTVLTSYEYVASGAAWHYDQNDLVPPVRKTWGQFRGYQTVRVRTGTAPKQTLTEHTFFRGMSGDRLATGSPRPASVDGLEDKESWRGLTRLTDVYLGDGGALVTRTVTQPTDSSVSASRPRLWSGTPTWGTLEARLTGVAWQQTTTPIAGGGSRTTRSEYIYDPIYGTLGRISDLGDVTTATDDTCGDITYARNTSDWVVEAVSRELVTGKTCDAALTLPADLVTDRRYYHDGATVWGTMPSAGDVTRTEEAVSWAGGPVYQTTGRSVLDAHGRPLEAYDGVGNLTRYAYTPAVGGPVTRTVVTNAKNFATTSTLDPARGGVTSVVDANGNSTSLAYDALGRLWKVWLPGRATSATPSTEFSYTVRTDGPNAVMTRRLLTGTTYVTSYELFDGLLRSRQTQRTSPVSAGGRIVSDTLYDSAGRVALSYPDRYDSAAPGTDLAAGVVPAQTSYVYDRASRLTDEIFTVGTTEAWRTTTSYGGSWIGVDPPAGATATSRHTDPQGRLIELRRYTGGAPSGSYDSTRYTYTKGGQLETVTDPAGNVWRYGYDLRGRRTSVQTPDSGTTVSTLDADGRELSTTDARAQTVAYTYDALGRRTGVFLGSTSGTKLAEWTYDTALLGKGLLGTSTRFAGGAAYTRQVTKYDNRGRETELNLVIPSVEGLLGGTYTTRHGYNELDAATSVTLPGGGSLAAEGLQLTYDSVGLPKTQKSMTVWYVADSTYTTRGEPESVTFGPSGGAQITRTLGYEEGTRRLSGAKTQVPGGAMLADVGYGYDLAGNVLSRNDSVSGDRQCVSYDHLRRVTDAFTGSSCASPSVATLTGPTPYWHSYAYDASGNRRTETQHAAAGDLVRTYGYPAAGSAQPHTVRSVTATGPGAGPAESYGYDAAGNLTSRPAGTLAWDAEGRLQSAGPTSFLYDADGQRLLRRDPGGTTLYLPDPQGDTELRLSGGAVTGTRYYRHGDAVVAVRTGGSVSYVTEEPQGTASLAVAAGTLSPTSRYLLPFGGVRGAVPAWPGERGFAGGTADASTGLIQLGVRYHNPVTGGFVSRDPVIDHADPQQAQGYAYASHSPFTFTDPDGRAPKPIACCSTPTGLHPGMTQDQVVDYLYNLPPSTDQYSGGYLDVYDDGGYAAEPVEYHQGPRPCAGWTQCLFPRPKEWLDSAGNRVAPMTMQLALSSSRGPVAKAPPKPPFWGLMPRYPEVFILDPAPPSKPDLPCFLLPQHVMPRCRLF